MSGNSDAYLRTIVDNLFTKPVFTELADCFDQGAAAASQAYGQDQNPYALGTAQREWWDSGWLDDTDQLCGT